MSSGIPCDITFIIMKCMMHHGNLEEGKNGPQPDQETLPIQHWSMLSQLLSFLCCKVPINWGSIWQTCGATLCSIVATDRHIVWHCHCTVSCGTTLSCCDIVLLCPIGQSCEVLGWVQTISASCSLHYHSSLTEWKLDKLKHNSIQLLFKTALSEGYI